MAGLSLVLRIGVDRGLLASQLVGAVRQDGGMLQPVAAFLGSAVASSPAHEKEAGTGRRGSPTRRGPGLARRSRLPAHATCGVQAGPVHSKNASARHGRPVFTRSGPSIPAHSASPASCPISGTAAARSRSMSPSGKVTGSCGSARSTSVKTHSNGCRTADTDLAHRAATQARNGPIPNWPYSGGVPEANAARCCRNQRTPAFSRSSNSVR